AGSHILDASIRVNINDESDPTANVTFHRMLTPWDENSTWNSLVDGVYRDNVEARVTADGRVLAPGNTGIVPIEGPGFAQSVQSWVNGAPNYGWVIYSDSTDGT